MKPCAKKSRVCTFRYLRHSNPANFVWTWKLKIQRVFFGKPLKTLMFEKKSLSPTSKCSMTLLSPLSNGLFQLFWIYFAFSISAFQRTWSQLKRVKRSRTAAHTVPESLIFAVIQVFTIASSHCIHHCQI